MFNLEKKEIQLVDGGGEGVIDTDNGGYGGYGGHHEGQMTQASPAVWPIRITTF